jgi:hypothetical protein
MGSNVEQATPEQERSSEPRNRDPEGWQGRLNILAVLALIAATGSLVADYMNPLGLTGLKSVSISLLVLAAIALPLLWFFTGVRNSKAFNASTLTVLALIFAGIGAYIAVLPENHSNPNFPAVRFDNLGPAVVPWCGTFDLTTSGAIPNGYKLGIFAAGSGPGWGVGQGYLWIGKLRLSWSGLING